jgi:hypothetical protein
MIYTNCCWSTVQSDEIIRLLVCLHIRWFLLLGVGFLSGLCYVCEIKNLLPANHEFIFFLMCLNIKLSIKTTSLKTPLDHHVLRIQLWCTIYLFFNLQYSLVTKFVKLGLLPELVFWTFTLPKLELSLFMCLKIVGPTMFEQIFFSSLKKGYFFYKRKL